MDEAIHHFLSPSGPRMNQAERDLVFDVLTRMQAKEYDDLEFSGHNMSDEVPRSFFRAGDLRRKIVLNELLKIRRDFKPGLGRTALRDELLRRFLDAEDPYVDVRPSERGLGRQLRRVHDPDSFVNNTLGETYHNSSSWDRADPWWDEMQDNYQKALQKEVQRRELGKVTKAIPYVTGEKKVSRRDLFRLLRMQGAKAVDAGLAANPVLRPLSAAASREAPLLLKLLKAIVTRKLHP